MNSKLVEIVDLNIQQIASICDHTFLCTVDSFKGQKDGAEYLREEDIKIASVIGFPNGNLYSTKHKIFETTIALENGADEIDMVLNYELFKSGKTQETLEDITNVGQLLSAAVKRDDGYIDLNPMKIRIGESGLLKK